MLMVCIDNLTMTWDLSCKNVEMHNSDSISQVQIRLLILNKQLNVRTTNPSNWRLQLSISNLEVDPICTGEAPISMHHSWQSLHGVYCHLPWSCHSLEFSVSEQIKTTMLCPNQRQRHYIKGTKERTSIFKIPNLRGLQNSHLIAWDSLLWSCHLCLWCSTVATLQLQLTCLVILQNN